ncbi:pseudouridine synthase [Vararia minispora EC-137]|uniref:Pseudouridine synthase n=1 Tax=Vararia minispora EC-137 TaxID=1314806 RepID=A0ACB8QZU3_9AGAM|nr:pseudouridine synthase [Vararia minispora EC-137]
MSTSPPPKRALDESLLPPSHALLEVVPPQHTAEGAVIRIMETDVGISEYIMQSVPTVGGIIKQRFTDFLVYEVDQDSRVVHIESIAMPASSKKPKAGPNCDADANPTVYEETSAAESLSVIEGLTVEPALADSTPFPLPMPVLLDSSSATKEAELAGESEAEVLRNGVESNEPWPESFTARLSAFLPSERVAQLKQMYLEGPEPPFISDSGWGERTPRTSKDAEMPIGDCEEGQDIETVEPEADNRGRGKRGRGGRGGRGRGRGGRGGRRPDGREDSRKVISDPIAEKTLRTEFHKAIRELFEGKLDSETDTSTPAADEGSRIVVKWSHRGRGRGGRGGSRGGRGRGEKAPRGTYPPYIHFTLQKTNRDTQDAISYLARTLHVNVKDLSVAGTKDKRGVTVQRVALRRGQKSVEDIWRLANSVPSKRSAEEAIRERGDHGIRVADFCYRKAPLELGMLKGNAFVITLRNVQVDSVDILNQIMESMKKNGFINYYGMQRFGTASIPTHSIGLALLKSDWHRAVSLILRDRPGEHPDVTAARRAWLDEKNLDKALALMPRRVVAERCILESYKKQKGDTRNAFGALSTIPRNLRLMYVHAYQSYVWNAIVSERIKAHGHERPVPGDLVLLERDNKKADVMDIDDVDDEGNDETIKANKKWEPPKVHTLTGEDVGKYSIFDVVMPLPGKDVAFPGGALGERYREYLRCDGLDPDNFHRRQKEYSLSGSYRAILHLPKELSWDVLRYTDPDVALAQADEDKLLGYDPPAPAPDGKFVALQIRLTLGTAAYATMALREITKTETSSHFQSVLTKTSEDQRYRGGTGLNRAEDGEETA